MSNAAMRTAEQAATSGPWRHVVGKDGSHVENDHVSIGREHTSADAEFIAQARQFVPRALAMIDAVLALHSRGETWADPGDGMVATEEDRIEDGCQECRTPWPCATVLALRDDSETTHSMATHHFVTASFDRFGLDLTLTCQAPAESLCRAAYHCQCEHWSGASIVDGRPQHLTEVGWDGERETHIGVFVPDACVLTEWFDHYEPETGDFPVTDGWLHDEEPRPAVTFPVKAEWTGDDYRFSQAGAPGETKSGT